MCLQTLGNFVVIQLQTLGVRKFKSGNTDVNTVERRLFETPINYLNGTLTNVVKAHLQSYHEQSLSVLDNCRCLCAKAFKFQTNLVTDYVFHGKKTESSHD